MTSRHSSRTFGGVRLRWAKDWYARGNETSSRLKLTGAALLTPRGPRLPERLRQLSLAASGSAECRDKHRGFYHAASDTLFAFRMYCPRDMVSLLDLADIRKQLDLRGLLSEETFDAALRKASA